MRKWGARAAILGGLWALALVSVLAVVHVRSMARTAGPPTRTVRPAQSVRWLFPRVPPGQHLGGFDDQTASSWGRMTGMVCYPGAAIVSGSWNEWGPELYSLYGFGTDDDYETVVRFYRNQYKADHPAIRIAQPEALALRRNNRRRHRATLMYWQEREDCRAVLIRDESLVDPPWVVSPDGRTSITLAHARLPLKMLPPPKTHSGAKQGVAPEELGSSVCPGGKVAYGGWGMGEAGKLAVARLEAPPSAEGVASFYKGQALQGGILADAPVYGFDGMAIHCYQWDAAGERAAVAILHLDAALPTVVWLQRGVPPREVPRHRTLMERALRAMTGIR